MIEKIKSALKIKYAHLGLSEEALNGAASLASITVTEESQIAAVVDRMEPALKGIQSDVDRRVNAINGEKTKLEADKLALEEKLKVTSKPTSTPPAGNEGDNKILEVIQELQKKIEGFESKQTQDQQLQSQTVLKESAKKLMIDKGITESSCDEILGTINISDGETADTLMAKGVEKNNKWQALYTPEAGTPPAPNNSGDFGDALDDFFKGKEAEANEN